MIAQVKKLTVKYNGTDKNYPVAPLASMINRVSGEIIIENCIGVLHEVENADAEGDGYASGLLGRLEDNYSNTNNNKLYLAMDNAMQLK